MKTITQRARWETVHDGRGKIVGVIKDNTLVTILKDGALESRPINGARFIDLLAVNEVQLQLDRITIHNQFRAPRDEDNF